jgi:hypothetical protein
VGERPWQPGGGRERPSEPRQAVCRIELPGRSGSARPSLRVLPVLRVAPGRLPALARGFPAAPCAGPCFLPHTRERILDPFPPTPTTQNWVYQRTHRPTPDHAVDLEVRRCTSARLDAGRILGATLRLIPKFVREGRHQHAEHDCRIGTDQLSDLRRGAQPSRMAVQVGLDLRSAGE